MIVVRVRENVIKCSAERASETFSEMLAELKETELRENPLYLIVGYSFVIMMSCSPPLCRGFNFFR